MPKEDCKMISLSFDIFSGRSPEDEEVRWLGVVDDLESACARMNALAAARPGPYFILRLVDKEILAAVDTTRRNRA